MGMDSYLYKTTKKEHEAYLKYIEDYNKLLNEFLNVWMNSRLNMAMTSLVKVEMKSSQLLHQKS